MNSFNQFIDVNKNIVGGEPVFKSTRVTIKTLFDYLEESSLEDFLEGHPTVTRKQAKAIIDLAAETFLTKLIA